MSRVSTSVEDLEGVGDDPGGGGHEPGVDPEVEDVLMVVVEFEVIFVVTFELLLELHVELLFEFPLEFLHVVASLVRAKGAGTRGEGHLGGGQTENLRLDGEARQLPRQKLVSS